MPSSCGIWSYVQLTFLQRYDIFDVKLLLREYFRNPWPVPVLRAVATERTDALPPGPSSTVTSFSPHTLTATKHKAASVRQFLIQANKNLYLPFSKIAAGI